MAQINDALKNLEDQIGGKAQQGTIFPVDNSNRKNIISWLIIKGVESIDSRTSNETLGKLYGLPNYLHVTLQNQKTGKNKYTRRVNLDFESQDPEGKPSIAYIPDELEEEYLPSLTERAQKQKQETPISYPSDPSQIKSLVESITRETIFRAINKEISTQRGIQKDENKKFQDAIISTVHTSVNDVLQKALEVNRADAISAAEEVVKNKIKIENENLKKQVEDIIFQSYRTIRSEEEKTPETIPSESPEPISSFSSFIPKIDPNYHFDPYATRVIRSAISLSENLYVYGDTGCGKTTHLEQVCAVLNHGIVRVNPHDGITREMFLGSMKLINNETIFVKGALPIAMENGFVFLVDEISFLPPNLTAILNPIGEKNGKLYIPETSEWITPQPGFCIFATDNTGGKGDRTGNYTGTEVQNTATLDRFAFCLKMDYLPQEKEFEMLYKRFPNQDQNEMAKILNLSKEIRSAFSRGELSITFSTRKLIKFFDQRENGFSISETLQNTILSWLDDDDSTLIKTMIDRLDILDDDSFSVPSPASSIDLSEFSFEVRENRMINAIKILRNLAGGQNLGLADAKEIAEAYRDGFIPLEEVKIRIIEKARKN